MRKIAIIGIGRLGGALSLALSRTKFEVTHLVHRSSETAQEVALEMQSAPQLLSDIRRLEGTDVDIVLIASADPEIASVANELVDILDGSETVLHTSGSLSSQMLSGLTKIGCSIGSIHPLVSLSDHLSGSGSFKGAFFCVEGDAKGYAAGTDIARSLGGLPFVVDGGKKALYHAAAVMACGHVTALIDLANSMIERCGIAGQDASHILLPLISSTMNNIEDQGARKALTGSFARADAAAVGRHIEAIESEMGNEILEIYLALGERSLGIAERNGVDAAQILKVRELIRDR